MQACKYQMCWSAVNDESNCVMGNVFWIQKDTVVITFYIKNLDAIIQMNSRQKVPMVTIKCVQWQYPILAQRNLNVVHLGTVVLQQVTLIKIVA